MNEMAPVNFPGFRSRDPSPAFALPRRSSGSTPRRASASSPPTTAPRRFSSTRPPFTATASAPSARCDQWPEQPSSVASLFAPVPGLFRVARRTYHAPSTMSRRLDTPLDDALASTRLSSTRPARSMPTNDAALDAAAVIREAPGGSAPTREQSHLLFHEPAVREITVINCFASLL